MYSSIAALPKKKEQKTFLPTIHVSRYVYAGIYIVPVLVFLFVQAILKSVDGAIIKG